eukprot:362120-Chlamydomonas_euryale.AAC.3
MAESGEWVGTVAEFSRPDSLCVLPPSTFVKLHDNNSSHGCTTSCSTFQTHLTFTTRQREWRAQRYGAHHACRAHGNHGHLAYIARMAGLAPTALAAAPAAHAPSTLASMHAAKAAWASPPLTATKRW